MRINKSNKKVIYEACEALENKDCDYACMALIYASGIHNNHFKEKEMFASLFEEDCRHDNKNGQFFFSKTSHKYARDWRIIAILLTYEVYR